MNEIWYLYVLCPYFYLCPRVEYPEEIYGEVNSCHLIMAETISYLFVTPYSSSYTPCTFFTHDFAIEGSRYFPGLKYVLGRILFIS